MSLAAKSCFVLVCDICGAEGVDEFFTPHYDGPGDERLSDFRAENGWTAFSGEDWCDRCNPTCECGHLFGEHDYGQHPCEVCGCLGWGRAPVHPPLVSPLKSTGTLGSSGYRTHVVMDKGRNASAQSISSPQSKDER